eukprot:15482010-Alexandrium_andersonii.AAC.1
MAVIDRIVCEGSRASSAEGMPALLDDPSEALVPALHTPQPARAREPSREPSARGASREPAVDGPPAIFRNLLAKFPAEVEALEDPPVDPSPEKEKSTRQPQTA